MYDKIPTDVLDQAEEDILNPTVTDEALGGRGRRGQSGHVGVVW